MAMVRPVTDLRDHFADITRTACETAAPIVLTGGESGELVLISRDAFQELLFRLEADLKLREAEQEEEETDKRYTFEEVYQSAMRIVRGE